LTQQIPAKGEQNCRWYILKLITKRWTPTGDIDRTEGLAGILGGQEAIDKGEMDAYEKKVKAITDGHFPFFHMNLTRKDGNLSFLV
jgi:hypothetical protein